MTPVAEALTPFVLAVLKYAFLALLYFFVFRAIRAVALDVSGRRRQGGSPAVAGQPARSAKPAKGGKAGKPPTQLLVRAENGKKTASFNLREPLQIGRAEACHVRLDDRYSSQFHARLYPKDGGWFLEDLGLIGRLSEHGVKTDLLEALVGQAVDDPCHKTNAVPVSREDFRALYLEVL